MRYLIAIVMIVIGLAIFVANINNRPTAASADVPTAAAAPFQMVKVQPARDGRSWFSYEEFQNAVIYYTGIAPNNVAMQFSCQPSLDHPNMYTSCLIQYQGNLFDVTRQNGGMVIFAHKE